MILHRVALVLLLGLVIGFGATSCGKKGDPLPPGGQKDDYPKSYPANDQPQSGIFSN